MVIGFDVVGHILVCWSTKNENYFFYPNIWCPSHVCGYNDDLMPMITMFNCRMSIQMNETCNSVSLQHSIKTRTTCVSDVFMLSI